MRSPDETGRLSLCMIVRNEAARLPECLDSVREVVDEIVLVDTGSADETIAIAERFGARVVQDAWTNDFAAARNVALAHARTNWVLVLDADERLRPECRSLVRRLITERADVSVFLVQQRTPTLASAQSGMTRVAWLPRLFRRDPHVRYMGAVHECILPSIRSDAVVAHSDVVVDHIGFLGGPEVVRSKAMRNLGLLAGILERDPGDGLAWIQRAECHASLGELDASIACYRRGLGWEGGGPPAGKTGVAAEIATAHQQLGAALFERGAFPEALAALDRGVALWPTLASGYALRGQTLARIGRWDDAIVAYEQALELAEGPQPPDQPVVLEPWVVWRLKGMAEATVGRDNDARVSLLRALALKPDLDDAQRVVGLLGAIPTAAVAKSLSAPAPATARFPGRAEVEPVIPAVARTTVRVPVSVVVHTRNEERNIAMCLESVAGWADELIVMDMESADGTVEIARSYGAIILTHPLIRDFDGARNVSAERATKDWILYLDADERMTPELANRIDDFLRRAPAEIGGIQLPYRNHFLGRWIRHAGGWYPGYKAPMLLRRGRFTWRPYAHQGCAVDGSVVRLPADDPRCAIVHHTYPDLAAYFEKLNRYTEGEAVKREDSASECSWQSIAEGLGRAMRDYYDVTDGRQDGPRGAILSFCAMSYELVSGLKHAERKLRNGWGGDGLLPPTAEVFLRHAAAAAATTGQEEKERPEHAKAVEGEAAAPNAGCAPQVPPCVQVVWNAPIFDPSGYADEARQFVLGLHAVGVPLRVEPIAWNSSAAELPNEEAETLRRLSTTVLDRARGPVVGVSHIFPPHFTKRPDAGYHIGRTMFETDRIPADWVAACNGMDEIWVPSEFNVETFAAAGVARNKLVKMPGGIDPRPFRLDVTPLPLAGRRGFTFLSVFDWSLRKGWDVLLRAFLEEFSPEEDVALVLKVWSSSGWPLSRLREQAENMLRATGLATTLPANVVMLDANLPARQLPALYRAADAYVSPTRGEGWGRPFMEAMLMGLPVIATRWSGHLEFMDDETAFLIDCEIGPVEEHACREVGSFRGHRWARPTHAHLRHLMRQVTTDRETGCAKGRAARSRILEHFTRQHVAHRVADRLAEIAERIRAPQLAAPSATGRRGTPRSAPETLAIAWEGSQFVHHSLALVNRELCVRLIAAGHEVSILPCEPDEFDASADARLTRLAERVRAPLSRAADIHLRHQWPPKFEPPPDGRWIMIQPWEYGGIPRSWVEPMSKMVDEIWVPSNFVRECYLESGIPADRVVVVPNGVDGRQFHPGVQPMELSGREPSRSFPIGPSTYTFLFVGGTIVRKGIDLLLRAYLQAFTRADDVCLVIKDMGTRTFYRGQTYQEMIRRIQGTADTPRILYLAEDLPPAALPGLYAACDCLVHPYRGEGFGLPIAEAMACGLPVLVTNYGAALDFCDPATAYLIPAAERRGIERRIGQTELASVPRYGEADVDAMAGLMRQVAEHRDEARALGLRGSARIRSEFTWEAAAERAATRLFAVRGRPARRL